MNLPSRANPRAGTAWEVARFGGPRRMGHDEAMTSSFGSNPEDEYADDEYADHDAEDREEPSVPEQIPDDEPEADVLEQRAEVPDDEDEDSRS